MVSRPFPITNGTRQGCPLSLLKFNLVMETLAEHVRSHLSLSGLIIGNTFHKISLFADDVILIFTNPASSLAEVHKTLNWFSEVSYYNVNMTKSFILDLKLDARTKNLLQQQHPYTWAEKDISYLGVQLTSYTKNLYATNFKPLLHKIQTESQQIMKHELSWSGRLAACKMSCLPQILYLFQTLPIPILTSFFRSLQKIFNKYIWNSKRHRCTNSKLIKHKLAAQTRL